MPVHLSDVREREGSRVTRVTSVAGVAGVVSGAFSSNDFVARLSRVSSVSTVSGVSYIVLFKFFSERVRGPHLGNASVPTHRPRLSRPYEDEGASMASSYESYR